MSPGEGDPGSAPRLTENDTSTQSNRFAELLTLHVGQGPWVPLRPVGGSIHRGQCALSWTGSGLQSSEGACAQVSCSLTKEPQQSQWARGLMAS